MRHKSLHGPCGGLCQMQTAQLWNDVRSEMRFCRPCCADFQINRHVSAPLFDKFGECQTRLCGLSGYCRVKAIYRSWAIPCTGKQVYARCHRAEWLGKINEPGVRRRAEFYYQQLDALRVLRLEGRRDLL